MVVREKLNAGALSRYSSITHVMKRKNKDYCTDAVLQSVSKEGKDEGLQLGEICIRSETVQ